MKLHLVPCTGEAHSNPHIDNCGLCSPLWGEVVTSASCGSVKFHLDWLESLGPIGSPQQVAFERARKRYLKTRARVLKALNHPRAASRRCDLANDRHALAAHIASELCE